MSIESVREAVESCAWGLAASRPSEGDPVADERRFRALLDALIDEAQAAMPCCDPSDCWVDGDDDSWLAEKGLTTDDFRCPSCKAREKLEKPKEAKHG